MPNEKRAPAEFTSPSLPAHLARSSHPWMESRLVDLRSPEAFGTRFIPGSYNVPDLDCVLAAQRVGLFHDRSIYLLADDEAQLELSSEFGDLTKDLEIAGWFGADALDEWQKGKEPFGSIEAVNAETLFIRMAAWSTLVFDIGEGSGKPAAGQDGALRFRFEELPLSMDGLPPESIICLTARTSGLASFAASLLWNFGFHNLSYLRR